LAVAGDEDDAMSIWQTLGSAIFTGNREWAWRRRIAICSAATMHACFIQAAFFDTDLAHATMVMGNALQGLTLVFTIYVAGAVADDKFKRDSQQQAGQP
jgi:hypothetical protein